MSRLLFSINSGRCGSAYLSHVLGSARGVRAFHEPAPNMAHRRLIDSRSWLTAPARLRKVLAIRRALPPGGVYAETSHLFILSFHEAVMRHLRNVEVILLRRYLPSVVRSLVELNAFAANDPRWRNWYADPGPGDPIDRAVAYVIGIEARAQRFRREYPDTPVHEVRIEELNSLDLVQRFLASLGLEMTERTEFVVGQRSNRKDSEKARSVSEEECRARIERYVARHDVPPLPQLEAIPC